MFVSQGQPDNKFRTARIAFAAVAVYVDLDRMDDARAALDEVLRLHPRLTVREFQQLGYLFQDPKRNDWYKDLLARAGLPE